MPAVKFDDWSWWHLAEMAETHDTTIAELITSAAMRLLSGTPHGPRKTQKTETLTDRFVKLRESGLTIQQIAVKTGYSKSHVSKLLTDAGHRTFTRKDAA